MNENKILSQKAMLGHLEGVQLCLNRGANAAAYNNEPVRNALSNHHTQVAKILVQSGAASDVAFEYAVLNTNIEIIDYLMYDAELVASGRSVSAKNILKPVPGNIFGAIRRLNSLKTTQYLLSKLNEAEIEDSRPHIFRILLQPNSYLVETQTAHYLIDTLMPTDTEIEVAFEQHKKNYKDIPYMDYIQLSRERAQLSGIVEGVSTRKFKL